MFHSRRLSFVAAAWQRRRHSSRFHQSQRKTSFTVRAAVGRYACAARPQMPIVEAGYASYPFRCVETLLASSRS